ncbi:OmpP1/FadL family transporter [Shimia sp. MIT1388]|uniref:OmpP1/FadL family transporter n=1 Tax=Shimia sp. MIT1388 TaxID=3096992 RepID=UPI00399B58EE
MKKALWGATALTLVASTSFAGGIDRSGQGVNILFEEGNYVQFTWQHADPSVTGTSTVLPTSNDVAPSYNNLSFGYKHEINENWDLALIYDQPYGAHIHYTDGPLSAGGAAGLPYNGLAEINSDALTALLQYNFGNGFSIHGGARALKARGTIQSGNGILNSKSSYDFGGVVGVAYEKPDIALRVALTYASGIKNGFEGTNSAFPAGAQARTFDVEFPESVNLDFQTGVAANTLVFGSVRWVGWDGFSLDTTPEGSWVNFDNNTTTYTLGVGQRINDKLSLALQLGYEKAGNRPTTTALAPTTGSKSIGLGATYQVNEQLSVSGGLTYAIPGDQYFQMAPGANIDFNDNSAWGAGIRIGYRF